MRRASSGWLSSARYGPPKPSPCALRRAAIFSKSARASAGSVAGFISSSVIEQLLFVIGPGARAGAEIVDPGHKILVGLDVDERGGGGGQRLFERARELRRLAHGEALRPERTRKSRPVVIGNAGELRRQRPVLARAQPDIAERGIVDDHVDDRQSVARRGLHLDAVHLHAAIAGDDGDPAIWPRALHADRKARCAPESTR